MPDGEKKKKKKGKKIVIIILIVVILLFFIGLLGDDDSQSTSTNSGTAKNNESTTKSDETSQTSSKNDGSEQAATEETQNSGQTTSDDKEDDSRYRIGDTMTFKSEDGGKYTLTLTEWGTQKDKLTDEIVMYVKYYVENIGDETVYVSPIDFNVYADDFSVERTSLTSDEVTNNNSGIISPGRKTENAFYRLVNPDEVSVIEVEYGNAVIVLKDDNNGIDNIPSSINADSDLIESYMLSGRYMGSGGDSSLSVSIYSSPEEDGIGNVEVYFENGQYSYNGEISEVSTNIYKLKTNNNDEVLLGVSNGDYIVMQLYVNGNYVEDFYQVESYES